MDFVFKILVIFTFFGFGQTDFCQYNFSASDLNRSAIVEIISFINGLTPGPYKPIDEDNVNFWLYTRTSVSGNRLNLHTPEISVKKTIVLIPGWLCNITNDFMPELKDAYLTRYDANVIIVDWSYYAAKTYGESYRYLPNIGKAVASFLMRLDNLGIFIHNIHLVGHSMGAQLSGLTGQSLISTYGKTLNRITGLDPAGPIYSAKFSNERLDETDAFFVDIIHSNGGLLGYPNRCGDVDFYPNCGTFQSGCDFSLSNSTFIDFIIHKIGCDHLRSVSYMIESINHKNFKSKKSIVSNELFCFGDSFDVSYMGEDSISMYNTDVCQYNFTSADVETIFIEELVSFSSEMIPGSYLPIVRRNIKFWLYTRNSTSGSELSSNLPTMPTKKTIVLVHGWLCNTSNGLMPKLKDEYLTRYDANIIMVDWSYYSKESYGKAFRYAPSIGETIANFLITIDASPGISIESIHVVGFCIGAQISGFTGQSLIDKYNKTLNRITGLDPAGPLYSIKPSKERLDETDATFVDIIHTNANYLGYTQRCGDVDFYPNCGSFQNGCEFDVINITFAEFIVKKIGCDHLRSVDYMIESVNQNNFKSKKSTFLTSLFCVGDNTDVSNMGEDSILKYDNAKYILFTNPSAPYASG
ncbi:hypothetical protein RN001_004134 [Aquatica leii]|uniref:Lipase domain-containing protein n=1 Tax=Aquatica leii TaxID=1421715 RepID=A0AAN7SRU0_9COLE|nr:hypothetical protein RN001_004134 [Aquatica leii]